MQSTLPDPIPPLRIDPSNGGEFYIVHDATKRIVAQGSYDMCALIVAGRPLFEYQGSLFGS